MNAKKYIVPVLAFLVIVVGMVWYMAQNNTELSPTEQPTATTTTDIFDMEPIVPEAKVSTEGWKTCRNEEYGWEVMYPGDWYVYSGTWQYKTEDVPLGDCQAGVVELSNQEPGEWVDLDKRVGVTIRSDQESFGTYRSGYANVRDLVRSYTELTVKGFYLKDGEEFGWSLGTQSSRINTYHKGNRFEIIGLYGQNDLLETILSTFHFLETATSTEQ